MTLTNKSQRALTITDVNPTGTGLTASGTALPVTLAPGDSTSLLLDLAPATTGDTTGTILVSADGLTDPLAIKHSGMGVHPSSPIVANPSDVGFGDVDVGARVSKGVTLVNDSTRPVSITTVSATGANVEILGLALPLSLGVGEQATFDVALAPTGAGAVAGNLSFRSDNQPHPLAIVAFTGNAVAPPVGPQLAAAPTTLSFPDVTVGTYSAQGVTLTNVSAQAITISQLDSTGTGFSASGLTLPATLAPGASATVSVKFAPTATGPSSGTLSVVSPDVAGPLATIDYTGAAVAAAAITSVAVRDAQVVAGQTVQMTADVTAAGTIDKSVTWSVEGSSAGTIDAKTGLYTAPSAAGTYTVSATSNADTTKKGYGSVTVSSPPVVPPPAPVVSISVSPTAASLTIGATKSFAATVAGTTNTAVIWSVQEGTAGGSITSNGVYTAPANAGRYHVLATSAADPSKIASATVDVTVPPPPIAVSLSPSTASVTTGATQSFTATVTGTSNTVVTWSIREGAGGVITPTGFYTAPTTAGTYHIVATSSADASKSATATVTVTTPATPPPPAPPSGTAPTQWNVTVSPPTMTNPTVITLPGNYLTTLSGPSCSGPGYRVNLPSDTADYIIKADAVLTHPVFIQGGHNVRVVGLEINLANANCSGTKQVPGSYGLRIDNVGTTYIEGLYLDVAGNVADATVVHNKTGDYDALSKGYTEAQARGDHDIVVQNSVIRGYYAYTASDEHADAMQTQGMHEIFRNIYWENVSVDSGCEGTIYLARDGYYLANSITMRNWDYRLDTRWTSGAIGGPVMHNAKSFSYSNVYLGNDVVRQYDVNTSCGTGCVQSCNGSNGIDCPATPSQRFASPGTSGASNAWTGLNYVSPWPI